MSSLNKDQLYKTELCRNWQEIGECRYGKKCRFAHGQEELRCVKRHVRYKTQICRTFHSTGTCLYGVRCTFIHDEHHASPFSTDTLKKVLNPIFPLSVDTNPWKSAFSSNIWSFSRRYSSSSSSSSITSTSTSSSFSLLSIPYIY
ncbi:uncharacterized protein BX663DRAFT_521380 [Cokeromyces recurvatus]|uniref:uncharacterized protein n=1 Tax=Cokeromyces recurvatus TaxID=90255 RepID=UPI00222125E4|nr:uncharacterized protein BX663DRAFT_521380 [Cokeromyces recurvatus]KAI7899344.1 hypothetical protein BX663DRAFT_521380 [Cokeromyces recurvatus]